MSCRAAQVVALTALLMPAAPGVLPAAPRPAAALVSPTAPAASDADSPDEVPPVDGPDATTPEDPSDAAEAPPAAPTADDDAPNEEIPLPPAAPRIASGPEYEACLNQLAIDPVVAQRFALAWSGRGGGIGAAHCRALAAVALGQPADGAAELDRLAHDSTADAAARATIYVQADQAWMLAAKPAQAVASATAALALTPDDPDALIDRARADAGQVRFTDAIADLDAALEIEPKRDDAIVARAGDLRRLDQLAAAAMDVDRVLARDPDDPDALLERGIIRQRQGNLAGARSDWEQASSLAPDNPTGDLARQDLALLEAGPQR